jgi:hypothetical protein
MSARDGVIRKGIFVKTESPEKDHDKLILKDLDVNKVEVNNISNLIRNSSSIDENEANSR